ncbi:MAG: hypothetical protein E6Q83_14370 [Thiothrix sp.]|nr:MAG: hypothetical protein E6Q83_14370 [Thiothrix sp.]
MKPLVTSLVFVASCLLAACNTEPSATTPLATVPPQTQTEVPTQTQQQAQAPTQQSTTSQEQTPTQQTQPQPTGQIVGGYTSVDSNDEGVQAAAQFAAQSLGGLLAQVTKAEQQVVAGLNYRLNLDFQDGSKHQVVVYKDLQGNMKLTQQ